MTQEVITKTDDLVILDEVEIEVYGKDNRKPPLAHRYVIRINKTKYTVEQRILSGTELLALAGKDPNQNKLYQKLHGGQLKEIAPQVKVDLSAPGIERFQTVPLNETEG